jgi:hypothetical protein
MKKLDENTLEIYISEIHYRLNDSFDFDYSTFENQPLGSWNHDIFEPSNPSPGFELLNSTFSEFREKTGIGNDFSVITNYIKVNKVINKIIISLNTQEVINIE